MSKPSLAIPSLKLHKGTNQGYVWWQGKPKYFGVFGRPTTDRAYWRWRESLGPEAAGITVRDVVSRFLASRGWDRCERSRIKNLTDALAAIGGLPMCNYSPIIFREHRNAVASTGTRSARQAPDVVLGQ